MLVSGDDTSLFRTMENRLNKVRQTIPKGVTLIAISKKQSVEAIRAAYALGLRHFGESRIQEAISKQKQLADLSDITWHFIGHLQSNKAAKALEHFQWIHSVHSLKLARRLNQLLAKQSQATPQHGTQESLQSIHAPDQLRSPNQGPKLFIQVKIVPDPSKSGWDSEALLQDLEELSQLSHLNVVGLMTIPPFGQSSIDIASVFNRTRQLATQIRAQGFSNIQMQELSMGMSGDYPLAIEAGATMVRIGRTIFGERTQ